MRKHICHFGDPQIFIVDEGEYQAPKATLQELQRTTKVSLDLKAKTKEI